LQNPVITNVTLANAGDYSLTITEGGITSTPATTSVEISEYPDINFTINPIGVNCINELITFTGSDNSGTIITNWEWDFGDGNSDNGQITTHSFNTAGTFNTSLTATNEGGCSTSTSDNIAISPSVIVTAGSNENVCGKEAYDFNTSSTLPDTSFCDSVVWNGGTGSFNNPRLIHPIYTPGTNESGTIQLSLTAYGFCSTDVSNMSLTFNRLPDVSFSIAPNDTICINETANFSGTNNNGFPVQSWQWDFGDGGSANTQSPTHTYSTAYDDNVRLIAINDLNCRDTVFNPITVIDPDIDFSFAPDPACIGTDIEFTGIGDADFTDWNWDFGDGNTATGHNTTHLYTSDGTFNVSLSVCSKNTTHQATINPGAFCDAGSDESYCDQVPFDFATSTIPPSASNYDSILWSGGAGSFSDPKILHPIYTPATGESGSITISLIAYGLAPCGNSTSTMTLTVGTLPDPDFSFSPNSLICVDDAVDFSGTNNNATTITNWNWDFGDGNSSNIQNPTHPFATSGIFDVELSLTSLSGCVKSISQQIAINEIPDARMTIGPSNLTCAETILSFDGTDNNGTTITDWEWDFGDGNTALGQNVNHAYLTEGTYVVSLNITNDKNCISSLVNSVIVQSLPQSDFTISPNDTNCLGELINLNASNISGDIVSWDWQFGDANTALGQNVTHTYNQAGDFNISSIFTNADGCADTTVYQRNIQDVNIGFDMLENPTCQNYIVDFEGTGDLVTFTSWNWDFGDGSSPETGHNVSHIYTQADTLDITLNVCSEQSVQQLIINADCEVNAGSDEATCQDVYFDLATSSTPPSASDFTSILWYSNGLGIFDNTSLIAPTYFPHPLEGAIQNDTIILTMVGYAVAPCDNDTSSMKLIVIPGAYAQAGSDENSCFNKPYDFANSQDSSFATNYASIYWMTSGSGSFVNPNVEQPIYIPGTGEVGPITLTMVASNIISCDSIDEMILTINPEYAMPFDTTVCFYDSVFAQGAWQHNSGSFHDTLFSIYGCDSIIVTNLTVRPKIDYNFTINTSDSICFGETVDFAPLGSANIINRLWDFGDGNTSSEISPSHQYDTSGVFNVICYYSDVNNCSDSYSHEITVFDHTDANFTSSMTNACVNTLIDFFGSNDSSIVSWQWDFGDGQSGNGQNVSHTYNTWGNITVTLTVLDANACSETSSQTFVIAQPPEANFSHEIVICDSIRFTDLSTSSAGYNLVSWYWEFGDGTTSDLQNPKHQYPHTTIPGGEIYHVSLFILADSNGFICSDSVLLPVSVPSLPDIFFTFDPDPTCFGDTTFFYGESGFSINNWHWDFDDGNFASEQYSNHLFTNSGSYNVELSIIDTNGCANNLERMVQVQAVSDVSFTMSDSVICHENVIDFFGVGSSNVEEWYWEFGDGSFSYDQNPTHYFNLDGNFTVSLTITDSTGCNNSTSKNVLVLPEPIADFSFTDVLCNTLAFTDLSTAPTGYYLTEWFWDFDDGFTSDLQSPIHSFATGGSHIVELTVTADSSGYGCSSTISQIVLTDEPPTVFFTWDPEPTTLGNTTEFFGTSGNNITSWYWDFGDGSFASTQNANHTYLFIGTFDVTLTVTDINGCINSITHQVNVRNVPGLDFHWDYACLGEGVQFFIDSPPTDIPAVVSWQWDFGDDGSSFEMEPIHIFTNDTTFDVSITIVDTMGASNTLTKSIIVNPLPNAIFNIETPACSGNEVQFHDFSNSPTGYISEWLWDFGDESDTTIYFPNNPDVSHIYNNIGPYEIILTVKNSDSCSSSTANTVNIIPSPIAHFTYSSGCANAYVEFSDHSVENGGGTILSWQWNFDDPATGINNTSSLENPMHLFSSFGVYEVSLTITNINGCTNTIITTVTVAQEPPLDFIFTNACLETEAFFEVDTIVTNVSEVQSYLWNFGDGNTSTLANPTNTYANTGDYVVTLSIITTNGCTASIDHIVSINDLPNSNFTHSGPACLDEAIYFTNLSNSPNGFIAKWHWDFGDGNSVTINTPDNPDVSHIYAIDGTFDVSLTVTDSDSCESTIVKQVVVLSAPIADYNFMETCYGVPVLFTDISSTNGGADLYSWEWYFGDPLSGINNNSSLQNPSHLFTNPGTYQVTLVVVNTIGCSDTTIKEVTVDSLPTVDFIITNDTICLNEQAQFTGIGDNVNSWFWEFGDGGTSIEQSPEYLYASPGSYNVKLTVSGGDGCQNSISRIINVRDLPAANFNYELPLCSSSPVQFIDQSTTPLGSLTEWIWDFGDGTPQITIHYPENPNITHAYTMAGTFSVSLTIMNSDSCTDAIIHDILIIASPIANFSFTEGCFGQAIDFTDFSASTNGEIINWQWNFGDPASGTANTSYAQNTSHIFSAPGSFDVILIIGDINGCGDTIVQTVTMGDEPAVEFTFTSACLGMETQFTVDETITDINNVQLFSWDFGDGNTSTSQNPAHTYASMGSYDASLTITTLDGCLGFVSHSVDINPLPNANFENTSPACLNDSIYFTDLSNSPNGIITTWLWDFGDGTNITINHPDIPDVAHLYIDDVTYEVSLTVTDDKGCEQTIIKQVEIVASPIADFNYEETCFGVPVLFTDMSTGNGGENLASWEWFFGDPVSGIQNHSTLENPSHIFSNPGSFTTTLIVLSTMGCSDTVQYEIIVDTLPDVDFTILNDSICLGEMAEFTGISSDNVSSWFWEFGDGGVSIEQNPTYMYESAGIYTVTLSVTEIGADQCQNSISYEIFVNDAPVANFSHHNACLGDSTYFTDLSYSDMGFVLQWQWDFGDGTTSDIEDPSHFYADNDSYEVTLISTDNFGCSDTMTKWIQIFDSPKPDFSFLQLCDPVGQVNFFDESQVGEDNSPLVEWKWNLIDGYYSTEIDPSYIYPFTDSCYRVILEITDANGCVALDTNNQVCLHSSIKVDFTSSQECLGVSTFLKATYTPEDDSVAEYSWNFNDGSPTVVTYHDTISHIFPNPGIFMVELIAVDTNGCSTSTFGEVIIDSIPTAQFTNTIGSCNIPTQFTDISFGGGEFIEYWYWDFGDTISGVDNFSSLENPSHLYGSNDSIYQVKLIVTNFNGCIDSTLQDVYVAPCLTADFHHLTGCGGLGKCASKETCFADSSKVDSNNGSINRWEWDFGDGTTYSYTDGQNPVCNTFWFPGEYEVQLIVYATINGNTYSDSLSKTITIYPTPEADMSVESNCMGDTTFFFDVSQDNGEPINYWFWDFGDESTLADTAIIQNPVYLYPSFNAYRIDLKVMNQHGCNTSISKIVDIYKPPNAEFRIDETCRSYYTHFTDKSSADSSSINNYFWNFGDQLTESDTSIVRSPQYIYDSIGFYDVNLTITDNHQCVDSISHRVEIYPIPSADFNIFDTIQQGQIYLENTSVDAVDYYWDFEFDYDVSTTETNPIHQYEVDGDYNIMLVAYNDYGCPDTTFKLYELLFTNLFVPNAFIPSSSNPELRFFKPIGINLTKYQIDIFSPWGNLVFHSTDIVDGAPAEEWDGTYRGEPLPTGSYIWQISAEFQNGTIWKGSNNGDGNTNPNGTVTLIR
jgi:PKD repeat protein